MNIPKTQRAVQLVGPEKLALNETKPVFEPGPHQILCRVEVCGLCFSDLKLLKQFSGHARKSGIASGINQQLLPEMPNYVPGEKSTVPGHEVVVRVAKVGSQVTKYKAGERYLIQADYRWLTTQNSAAAFGYNFEGGLQEYTLLDERVIHAPDGESTLIPVPEEFSASALALCEPWACVEEAYVEKQRRTLREGDVVYHGNDPAELERLFTTVPTNGLMVICQHGKKFGRPVITPVGRTHYGGIRIVGTTGDKVEDALASIPADAEMRPNDKVNIIGAAGPMGTMHVIRDLCQGVPGIAVHAGDLSDDRLAMLKKLAEPLAKKNKLTLHPYNPKTNPPTDKFNYIVLMAPVPALVVQAVKDSAPKAIINIFAGIPADKTAEVDLDMYIEKQCYFVGTSGSTTEDMKTVLRKVVTRQLDTNLSVAAISGLEGAIDGIHAVEKNLMPGKILVYPSMKGMKLTALPDLTKDIPLTDGHWTIEAEKALLKK
ncbi:MAG: alcohol dehydrogenase catalytic domain-containing protein [Verrucomicrobiota bacterium]